MGFLRSIEKAVPDRVKKVLGGSGLLPRSSIDFGDLRSVKPVSRYFGFDRGLPIDRHFIESFLAQHSEDIAGRLLEVGSNDYTLRFGKDKVIKSDVLHVDSNNKQATFAGDLAEGSHLPSDAFDCIILTQTLQLVYDVPAAIRTLHRVLKPGGVLLMTTPGTISQLEQGTWSSVWHWGFTALSMRKLCEQQFPPGSLTIEVYGNVLASIAFLQGLAADELTADELAFRDPLYPLVITVRAQKQ